MGIQIVSITLGRAVCTATYMISFKHLFFKHGQTKADFELKFILLL